MGAWVRVRVGVLGLGLIKVWGGLASVRVRVN